VDWFEWKFLGRVTDPVCGHSWYVGSGTYTLMQLRAGFAAGHRFAKYLTSGVSGEGAWIAKAMGWFMGVILGLAIRLEFGVLMIPIQALAGLFQAKKTTSDIVTRVVVFGITLTAVGIGFYKIQHPSWLQLQQVQPSPSPGFSQFNQFKQKKAKRKRLPSQPPVAGTSPVLQPPGASPARPVPGLLEFQKIEVPDYRRYNVDFLKLIRREDGFVCLTKSLGWVDSGLDSNPCAAQGCLEVLPTCQDCILEVDGGGEIIRSSVVFGSPSWQNEVCNVCNNKGATLKFRVSPDSRVDQLCFMPPFPR
jgi:hypothetical protein